MTWNQIVRDARAADGPILVLTGAGISAESGVPTFRGPEGYWRIGSRNYQPEELATRAAFERLPEEIWSWYLHRRSVCLAARPNAAHLALVDLERALGERFLLVTQNVDGLHARAGQSAARTLQVHGNLHFMRCALGCGTVVDAPPQPEGPWEKGRPLDSALRCTLRCAHCGGWMRPHVLWFDEHYDEPNYRYRTALAAAERCALLLVVGTAGATSLPAEIVRIAFTRQVGLVVVGPEPTPFSELAPAALRGCFVQGTAVAWVPRLAAALGGAC